MGNWEQHYEDFIHYNKLILCGGNIMIRSTEAIAIVLIVAEPGRESEVYDKLKVFYISN